MRWSFLLSIAFAFFSHEPRGTSPDAASLVRKFEAAYRPAKTLRATFLERYFDNGKLVRADSGVAYFGKPGKMRWEYQSPEPNLYVIDGKWSWFYVPSDHTVTRMPAKQSSDSRTPFSLLAGEMRVSRICKSVFIATSSPPSSSDGVVLHCEFRTADHDNPSSHSKGDSTGTERSYALFEVDPGSGKLVRVLVVDPGGVKVEFQFTNWEFDPHLEVAMFQFRPQKGVAIVDGELGTRSGFFSPPGVH